MNNEVQWIAFGTTVSPVQRIGGNCTLSFNGTTSAQGVIDDVGAAQTVLEQLLGSGNVSVSSEAGYTLRVEFTGSLGNQDVTLLTAANNTLLQAATAPYLNVINSGSNPSSESTNLTVDYVDNSGSLIQSTITITPQNTVTGGTWVADGVTYNYNEAPNSVGMGAWSKMSGMDPSVGSLLYMSATGDPTPPFSVDGSGLTATVPGTDFAAEFTPSSDATAGYYTVRVDGTDYPIPYNSDLFGHLSGTAVGMKYNFSGSSPVSITATAQFGDWSLVANPNGYDALGKPLGIEITELVKGVAAEGSAPWPTTAPSYYQMTSLTTAVAVQPPANARYVLAQAEGANVRWRQDGSAPTAMQGMLLLANVYQLFDGDLALLQFIAVDGSPKLNLSFLE